MHAISRAQAPDRTCDVKHRFLFQGEVCIDRLAGSQFKERRGAQIMRMGIEQTRVSGMECTETLDFHDERSWSGFDVVRTWVKNRYPKIVIFICVSRCAWLNPFLAYV